MQTRRFCLWFILAIVLFSACAPPAEGPPEGSETPTPGIVTAAPTLTIPPTHTMVRPPTETPSPASTSTPAGFIDELIFAHIIINDLGATLYVAGVYPDTCTRLQAPIQTQTDEGIAVLLLTERFEAATCVQEPQTFFEALPVGTSGLEPGLYRLAVNRFNGPFRIYPPPGEPPTGCPEPTPGTWLHISRTPGYCVLLPADWGQQEVEGNFVSPPLTTDNEPVRVGLSLTPLEPANGRTLDQVYDEWLPVMTGDPNWSVVRTPFTLGGEPAILVEGIPGRFPGYNFLTMHNEQVYSGHGGPIGVGPSNEVFLPAWEQFVATFQWID